jgi:ABC-type enterochelin transport system permease subunit
MSYQPACRSVPATSSLAIVSLVFGILSWCLLPFIGAIVAIVCGHMARSEIRQAPVDSVIEGDGMAIAGLILGYVHLLAWAAAIMLVIGVLFLGAGLHWF